MANEFAADVLIVGAGAAGLTLAIDLARRGVSFRLIDKLDGPFQGSRGKGIQPRTLEVFEDLGIVDRMVVGGGAYPPQREYRSDGSYNEAPVVASLAPTPSEPYQTPWLVPQFVTESVMRDRLAEFGSAPRFGCELTAFDQDADGVVATLASPSGAETIRVRYLVGADGGRSAVRHALGIPFPGETLGVRAVVADAHIEGLGRDAWHRFNEGDMQHQISFCPLTGTDMFQLQAPIPLEGDVDRSAEGLTVMVATRTGRTGIVIRSVSWSSAFNMNARLADRYSTGRAFLAGDAAHIHPPTGGQGLNTSIQDAYNLGWKLASVLRGAPETLLATYEQERRPIAAHTLGLTTTLLEEAKQGSMRRGRETHQLDVGYPQSPLAFEAPERRAGLCAGERAPDAPVRGAAGMPTRLFNLFKGTHWTLLAYEVERAALLKPRAGLRIHTVGQGGGRFRCEIIDDEGHFRDAYGVAVGDCLLVRPDGYVGAVVSAEHRALLEEYLEGVGLRV